MQTDDSIVNSDMTISVDSMTRSTVIVNSLNIFDHLLSWILINYIIMISVFSTKDFSIIFNHDLKNMLV